MKTVLLAVIICLAWGSAQAQLGKTLDQAKGQLGKPKVVNRDRGDAHFLHNNLNVVLHFTDDRCDQVLVSVLTTNEQQGDRSKLSSSQVKKYLKMSSQGKSWKKNSKLGSGWLVRSDKGAVARQQSASLEIMTVVRAKERIPDIEEKLFRK